MALNKVFLQGNVVNAPELRKSTNGTDYLFLTIAISDYNGKENVTYFPQAVAYGKIAQHIEKYFKKGQEIIIEAKIQTQIVETKDGFNGQYPQLILTGYPHFTRNSKTENNEQGSSETISVSPSDLPF